MPERKTILIVDDEEIARTLAADLLSEEYTTRTADSPQTAYQILHKIQPDCIILDLYMPEEDGMSMITTLSLNPSWADIPVIFLTSETDAEIEAFCIESGAVDFIRKPFNHAVLKSRISRAIATREAASKKVTSSDAEKAVIAYLLEKTQNGSVFFKSKDIAKELNLTSRVTARCITELASHDHRFTITAWGTSNASIWKITLNAGGNKK